MNFSGNYVGGGNNKPAAGLNPEKSGIALAMQVFWMEHGRDPIGIDIAHILSLTASDNLLLSKTMEEPILEDICSSLSADNLLDGYLHQE
ncbi:hypothetical protein V6N12_073174 [Hibiscus sabdariffa]|uniref:Uncharacterized protein n=1 Tax=Hibiscus sabdariffa TaxID=183260 RepID=A0ABR2B6W7_9ROSI